MNTDFSEFTCHKKRSLTILERGCDKIRTSKFHGFGVLIRIRKINGTELVCSFIKDINFYRRNVTFEPCKAFLGS